MLEGEEKEREIGRSKETRNEGKESWGRDINKKNGKERKENKGGKERRLNSQNCGHRGSESISIRMINWQKKKKCLI